MRRRRKIAWAIGSGLILPLLSSVNCTGTSGPRPCTRSCQDIIDDLNALSEALFPGDLPPPGAGTLYLCCGGDLVLEAYDCGCDEAETIGIQTLGTREEVVDAIRTACETVPTDCPEVGPPDNDGGEEDLPDDPCMDDPVCVACANFSDETIDEIRQRAEDDLSSGVPYIDALVNASDWCFDRFQADPSRQPECVVCAGAIVFDVYPTPQ